MSEGSSFLQRIFGGNARETFTNIVSEILQGIPFIGDWLAERFENWAGSSGPGMGNAAVEGRPVTAEPVAAALDVDDQHLVVD